MSKFLYGAAVQGIQDFIFQTNKLQEIVGASELVEQVCTTQFAEALGLKGDGIKMMELLSADKKAIVNAAGNIKYIFDDYDSCQNVVKLFPKKIVEHAPGITISQAVVKFGSPSADDNKSNGGTPEAETFEMAVMKLEEKLRAQRNKPMRSPTIGMMGIERSRQTGFPVIAKSLGKKDVDYDAATYKKLYDDEKRRNSTTKLCQSAFGCDVDVRRIPYSIENITGNNDWIAIIHADGNGLGQVVQKIGKEAEKFKVFSQDLDAATKEAAQGAFKSLTLGDGIIPIRPIVLSGDDHTLICRADLAIPYVNKFIELFEKFTEEMLADKLVGVFSDGARKLSACAGIAFIKSSYPFYYGYQLAEELCGKAKKDTKEKFGFKEGKLPPSCIMFHKVQDSFVTNYDDIIKRELTPCKGYSLKFGPYYINKVANDRWTINDLILNSLTLNSDSMAGVKTGLRRWLSAIAADPENARQRMERLKSISQKESYLKTVYDDWEESKRFPIYDILTVNTINTQKTK